MAVRRNAEMPAMTTTPDEIMEAFTEFGATKANPMPLSKIAAHVADTPEAVWAVLDAMETEGKADLVGPYLSSAWWPLSDSEKPAPQKPKAAPKPKAPTAAEENAKVVKRTRRTKAEMEAAQAEEAAKNAYAVKAAESQDEVLSQTPENNPKSPTADLFKPAPDALPKGTQVTLSDGTPATVIADEVITVKVPKGEPFNWERILTALRAAHAEASNSPEGYIPPEEVTSLPARPEGVNENTWFMVFNAHSTNEKSTLAARIWWTERAMSQAD